MSADLSRCPSAGQLRQLLDEQLSGPDRDTVETHVESCHSCQEHLERLIPPPHAPRPAAGTAGQGAPEPDEGFLSRLR
ncbi:MAG TPA: zf-HC2 domain-containing protein, partial [Gemmataceae bacterium]